MVKKEIITEVLENISKRDGVLRPEKLVEEAENPESPVHDLFEWDDTAGGHQWRLSQARRIIGRVKIEYKGREVNSYYSVHIETIKQQGYYSLDQVLSNEDLHRKVLMSAIKEITYWQEKYKDLTELAGIIDEAKIEEVKMALT